MADRKPVVINGEYQTIPATQTLDKVVDSNVTSVTTGMGEVIPFDKFRQTPVPDSIQTNIVEINKGAFFKSNKQKLLAQEVEDINAFLQGFYPTSNGQTGRAYLENDEILVIKNFPLPSIFKPDHVDLVLLLPNYPQQPPHGIHVLQSSNNKRLLDQLKVIYHHTYDSAVVGEAVDIPNYSWICYHYNDFKWHFSTENRKIGDNVAKYLNNWRVSLDEVAGE